MARPRSFSRLITFVLSAVVALEASAQTSATGPFTTAPPSSIASSAPSTITSAPSPASAQSTVQSASDAPQSLWDIANSLLSSYYPSSSITQVYSLTWPTAVVIESSTYSVHPASPTDATTSVLAEATGSSTPSHGLRSDAKLGIGIGVAVGAVALIVLGIVLCCLRRRKRATGAFFKRRPTPSITDSDLESWRSPVQPEMAAFAGPTPPREWTDKYNRVPGNAETAQVQPPPMALHPAFARQYTHWSNTSSSEENPFFTPNETPDHYEMSGANHSSTAFVHEKEVDGFVPVGRRSSDSIRRTSRPPTPFSPMLMMGAGAVGARVSEDQGRHNPFSSPEDYEADDIVSPIIPARSPERRHSPMVHYPSWSEVSEFDFTGHGRAGQSIRGQSSSEDGGDGWRPVRDSVYGRHELA